MGAYSTYDGPQFPADTITIKRVQNGFIVNAELSNNAQHTFIISDDTDDALMSIQDVAMYVIARFMPYIDHEYGETVIAARVNMDQLSTIDTDTIDTDFPRKTKKDKTPRGN